MVPWEPSKYGEELAEELTLAEELPEEVAEELLEEVDGRSGFEERLRRRVALREGGLPEHAHCNRTLGDLTRSSGAI